VASTYALLGQKESAFRWLDRALRVHEVSVVYVQAEPTFQSLRSDERWLAMRRRFASLN